MLFRKKSRSVNKSREVKLADRYAHRGYHDKPDVPENSMAAFRRAAERGFPVEFDVHMIADGSLVIFHDEDLRRETGADGQIEDYDITNLSRLRLEGTDEHIPTFDEVLELFEPTGLPLLIELKTARGNYRELTRAVCERLDSYTGEFVIESFDPRALIELKRIRPHIVRGQLVQNFFKHREDLPLYQSWYLTRLISSRAVRPDFIAFRFGDIDHLAMRRMNRIIRRSALPAAVWTIRTPDDYRAALDSGCIPIFEQFDPDSRPEVKQ